MTCPICNEPVGEFGFACSRHRGHPHCVIRYYREHDDEFICPLRCPWPTTERAIELTGFEKPRNISEEMSNFCGGRLGDLKSSVDVTSFMCRYIRDNNLQNPCNRREIIPDEQLTQLLGYDADTDPPLTYFALQRYLAQHWVSGSSPTE